MRWQHPEHGLRRARRVRAARRALRRSMRPLTLRRARPGAARSRRAWRADGLRPPRRGQPRPPRPARRRACPDDVADAAGAPRTSRRRARRSRSPRTTIMADPRARASDVLARLSRAGRRPRAGRLRHRLLVARPPQAPAGRRAEDRPLVRRRPADDAGDAAIVRTTVELAHIARPAGRRRGRRVRGGVGPARNRLEMLVSACGSQVVLKKQVPAAEERRSQGPRRSEAPTQFAGVRARRAVLALGGRREGDRLLRGGGGQTGADRTPRGKIGRGGRHDPIAARAAARRARGGPARGGPGRRPPSSSNSGMRQRARSARCSRTAASSGGSSAPEDVAGARSRARRRSDAARHPRRIPGNHGERDRSSARRSESRPSRIRLFTVPSGVARPGGDLLLGEAAEVGELDRLTLDIGEGRECRGDLLAVEVRRRPPARCRAASGSAAARPLARAARRSGRRRRTASTARWWTIERSHVLTLPLPSTYRPAFRHAPRKASCTTSSASEGVRR